MRCGNSIDRDDAYKVVDPASDEFAWICRVEHLVAWVMRGAGWDSGTSSAGAEAPLALERHRAGATTTHEFDNPEALRAWASAGGPWAAPDPADQ